MSGTELSKIQKLIPANGQYPSTEVLKIQSLEKELEIRKVVLIMPAKGGRAG